MLRKIDVLVWYFPIFILPLMYGYPTNEFNQNGILDSIESSNLNQRNCPATEHWSPCMAHCQKTCIHKDGLFPCPNLCVAGCVCNAGFVRGYDGKCKFPSYCSNVDVTYSQNTYNCPTNQHWEPCRAHCGRNCTNYGKHVPCPSICISGCACNSGFVWGPDGDCILPSKCSKKITVNSLELEDFCPPNEEFSKCNSHCQRNCTNWSDTTLPCLKLCVPGCSCVNGMVRGPHGNCIWPRQCPSRYSLNDFTQSEHECPIDEHFERCSAHNQRNCSTWNQTSTTSSICISGCICDRGYVRGPSGRCLSIDTCILQPEVLLNEEENSHSCPLHEIETNYRALSNFKKYCIHDYDYIVFCPVTFLKGCVCDKGLIRGPEDKCLDPRLLPNANELEFIHNLEDDIEPKNDDRYSRLEETVNNERLETLDNSVRSLPESHKKDADIVHSSKQYGGCPDEQQCSLYCNIRTYSEGACIGRHNRRCICFTTLDSPFV